ncbi:MAG: hypothetical protein HQ541_21455, partial [Mariniphaga sp.]|nr:hypothetical protein [Mariniphaga sp.]
MFPEFIIYLAFLFIIALFYYGSGKKAFLVLFGASIIFISFISLKAAFYALLITAINYLAGIITEKVGKRKTVKNIAFWFFIILNISFLGLPKYFNTLFENLNQFFPFADSVVRTPFTQILIPIGISYYIFQALGYIILINRGTEKAERNFFRFASLMLFFPKMISGPVE